jgi:hypothetical protein
MRVEGKRSMDTPTVQAIVNAFTRTITDHLDASKLDGPMRLDPTRSIVIIPLKGKGPIHAYTDHQIDDAGVQHVITQLQAVPSFKGLVK